MEIKHNWNKKTLGKCALAHLDSMIYEMHCCADKKERREAIFRILKHFETIRSSIEKEGK